MKTLFALLILLIPNYAFSCANSYAPDNWNVTTKSGNKLSLDVFGIDGGQTISLNVADKSTQQHLKQIELKTPKENQVWLFGSCSIGGMEKSTVFALAEKSENPGWAKKYYEAYQLNTETLSLKELNVKRVKCYDSGHYQF